MPNLTKHDSEGDAKEKIPVHYRLGASEGISDDFLQNPTVLSFFEHYEYSTACLFYQEEFVNIGKSRKNVNIFC